MGAGKVVKLSTDGMVLKHIDTAMMARSSMLMAELRRPHEFLRHKGIVLQMHHLPSALNLYAERLSRHLLTL